MNRKALLYTLLAAPVFAIVSTPLSFLVGAVSLIFLRTDWANVYPGDATIGFFFGAAMMATFTLYGSIATYKHVSEASELTTPESITEQL